MKQMLKRPEGVEMIKGLISEMSRPVIFLSGGSSVEFSAEVIASLDQDVALKAKFAQIDERITSYNHKDSNGRLIREKIALTQNKLLELISKNGLDTTASEASIRALKNDESVAILGMGADAHTAGILPLDTIELFRDRYDAPLAGYVRYSGPDYERYTLNYTALNQFDHLFCYVSGSEKLAVLRSMKDTRPSANQAPIAPLLDKITFIYE